MKANRPARQAAWQRQPDGGQMLLLAGFILAGAAIIAIGSYTILDRTETDVLDAQRNEMVDLFLNTRGRSIDFFQFVSADDTNSSILRELDGYLVGQYRTARSLSMDLNATLASDSSDAPEGQRETALCTDGTCNTPNEALDVAFSHDGGEDLSCLTFDGTNDGLLTDPNTGTVYAAVLWLRIFSTEGKLEETIVVDVPSTSPGC